MLHVSGARRWTIISLLFASGFINYLDRAILSVALPLIAADLHLGPSAKGVLLSAFFWSYALMQLVSGWFSDRLNLRWLYAGAFALWSVSCGLTGFAATLGALLALRVILGIGESIYLPGGMKIVSLLFESKDRGLASGLVNCGTRVGLALGAPLIAWAIDTLTWPKAFVALGFGGLVWLVPWLAVFPSHRPELPASRPAGAGLGGRPAWIDRNLFGLCLGHIAFSYYWYLLVTWLPDYLVESRHLPLKTAGAFAFFPYLVFSISEPLGGWIADRLIRAGWSEARARKTVVTFAFSTSLLLLLGGRAPGDAAAISFIAGASMVGLATGNLFAMLQRIAPPGEVGFWSGILNFAGNLSGIVAPVATGVLIERTGSYFPGFAVAVAVLLAGLPAYWFIVGDLKRAAARG